MPDDEFDNLPDEFADVQGVDWAQLLGRPSVVPNVLVEGYSASSSRANVEYPRPISPHSSQSSQYFLEDDMDSAFLAELDQVEQRVTGASQVASSSLLPIGVPQVHGPFLTGGFMSSVQPPSAVNAPQPQSHYVSEPCPNHLATTGTSSFLPETKSNVEPRPNEHADPISTIPIKRTHSDENPHVISPKWKGKMKSYNEIQQILASYEDELTCPICCDIFRYNQLMKHSVASHVGNPCGHTFCGDCGWQWHKKKACPCCRIDLSETLPMIPNIAMDNTVEKHVKALALSGAREWEPGGQKLREWEARKQAWCKGAAKREQQKKTRRTEKSVVSFEIFEPFWLPMGENEEADPDYIDSDVELIPRPIQRARRRRG